MILALLLGCPKAPDAPAPPLIAEAPPPAPALAGDVRDGVFRDARFPFGVTIPPGWTAVVGLDGEPRRVTLVDPSAGVEVEIAVTPEPLAPRPREGCDWTFVDDAPYRAPGLGGVVRAGTCTPLRAGDPRVLGWYTTRGALTWHVEATVPDGRLLAGKLALDEVSGGLSLQEPSW